MLWFLIWNVILGKQFNQKEEVSHLVKIIKKSFLHNCSTLCAVSWNGRDESIPISIAEGEKRKWRLQWDWARVTLFFMVSFFHVSTPFKKAFVDVTVIQFALKMQTQVNQQSGSQCNARAIKLDKKFSRCLGIMKKTNLGRGLSGEPWPASQGKQHWRLHLCWSQASA